jgi:hypothetical protein
MKKINYLILLFTLGMFVTSCEKEKIETESGAFSEGIYVVNEGNFNQGNSSISFVNENLSKVENDVFHSVNSTDLGDQAQSIGFSEDNAYIVVTASNKIEVVDKNTMERKVSIASGLENPRYFEAINNNTGLVSCWGDTQDETDDYLAIVNLNNNTVTGQIQVALGPEKMVKNNRYLFIAHKGAWGTNNKVSVYDLVLKQITNIITVGNRPNSMVITDDYLWVLCAGEPYWTGNETAGQLYKININNGFDIEQVYDFDTTEHPNFLCSDADKLFYYLNGKIYTVNTTGTSITPIELFTYQSNYYGAYNMEAYNGKLYITDAADYTQEGEISCYKTTDGSEIARKTVGIIPGDIGFNFE